MKKSKVQKVMEVNIKVLFEISTRRVVKNMMERTKEDALAVR